MIRRFALATAAITATALLSGISWTTPAGAAAPAASAPPTDQSVSLPFGNLTDLLIDRASNAGDGLVVASGSQGIAVSDLDGSNVALIDGTSGVSKMALGPDGLIYATRQQSDQILIVNPATKTVVKSWPTNGFDCPYGLAFAGDDLWFGYNCDRADSTDPSSVGIAHLNLTDGTIVAQLQHRAGNEAPLLTSVPTHTDELIVRNATSSQDVSLVGVGGTTAALVAQVNGLDDLDDRPVVTPDGSTVLVVNGDGLRSYSLPNLNPVGTLTYSTATAVALSGDGDHVALSTPQLQASSVTTFTYPGGAPVHTYALPDADSGNWTLPVWHGLAWDGDTLYSVDSLNADTTTSTLHILHTALQAPTAMSLRSATSVGRAKALPMTGHLATATGASLAGQSVLVAKRDAAGVHQLGTFVTDSAGLYHFTDVPAVGGPNKYVAVFAGDKTHSPITTVSNVNVLRGTPVLTMKLDSSLYNYRQASHLSVHLGSHDVKKVQIWVKAGAAPLHYYTTLTVNSQGNAAMAMAMSYNTLFAVKFYGDYYYNARVISTSVQTRAGVAVAMAGSYGNSGGYALYHAGSTVYVGGAVGPTKPGQCLRFDYYGYVNGAWSLGASDTCVTIQSDGVAASGLQGAPVGIPLRVHAIYHGDSYNAGNYSGWAYFILR